MRKIFLVFNLFVAFRFSYSQSLSFAKRVGGTSFENAMGIAVDSNKNIILSGYFAGTADFDPSPSIFNLTSQGGNDIFLAKYDSAGGFLWAIDIGGQFEDFNYSDPVTDAAGNIYLCGQFGLTVDFDPSAAFDTLSGFGSYDGFIAAYNSNGNCLWAKQFGGMFSDYVYRLDYDNNSILFTGTFDSIADLDPTVAVNNFSSSGKTDVFFGRLDVAGNLLFVKTIGGHSDDGTNNIAHDHNGDIVIVGSFTDSADFDPSASSYFVSGTGFPSFLSKYDANGNFIWAIHFNNSIPYGLGIDASNNILTCGNFMGTVDFDPGTNIAPLSSAGNFDIYFGKYDSAGNYVFVKRIGGTGLDLAYAIRQRQSGIIFLSGYFNGTVDFDPGNGAAFMSSAGLGDIFIAQFDTAGNYSSSFRIGSSGFDFCRNFSLDTGCIYIAGGFEQNVDFDPGAQSSILSSTGSRDGYFAVYGDLNSALNNYAPGNTDVIIYPNPFSQSFYLECLLLKNKDCRVEIYNAISERIFISKKNVSGKFKVDLSNEKGSVFFLRLYDSGIYFSKKIIKQ